MKKIIIQGFPYDEKSSYMKGARQGPGMIREVLRSGSANSFAENGLDTDRPEVEDKGDFEILEYFDIEKIAGGHLQQEAKLLSLGGDHSITYPIVKAYNRFFPLIDILHIDAHPDLYSEYDGDPYSHACPFARIMEGGYAARLVQVGIRAFNDHQRGQAERLGVESYEMKDLDIENIPPFSNPVYLSIDMDGFDPAYAPGVSHLEPGGLSSRQVMEMIRNVNTEIVGADIVEYNPGRDPNNITGALAAKLLKEILGKMIGG